ncbi:MAG: hypothetical protein HQL50_15930, partial [Magnetococcales bacterium]|nr:hypothetical protein [Magnetococcales bacterium]
MTDHQTVTAASSSDAAVRLDALLNTLESLRPPETIHLGLQRSRALMAALQIADLDQPRSRPFRILHVAGTNGKGSVIAFLEQALRENGYPVCAYTSPHLTRFNERIRLDGRSVDDAPLVDALEQTLALAESSEATYFECTTAAAFSLFAHWTKQRLADTDLPPVWLLETGLGGRLDATNVVTPDLSLITSISRDHTAFLGETIPEIAGEKAGIIKPGVPVVTDPGDSTALTVITETATHRHAPLTAQGVHYHLRSDSDPSANSAWHCRIGQRSHTLPPLSLPGKHQLHNAGLAVAALDVLASSGWTLDWAAISRGIAAAIWPGRMERLSSHRRAHQPTLPEIWLDAAHNSGAAAALADTLSALPEKPTGLLLAILNDKEVDRICALLAPLADRIWLTTVPSPR